MANDLGSGVEGGSRDGNKNTILAKCGSSFLDKVQMSVSDSISPSKSTQWFVSQQTDF